MVCFFGGGKLVVCFLEGWGWLCVFGVSTWCDEYMV